MINLFDICKLRADLYHTTPHLTTILLWSTINVNFKTNSFTIQSFYTSRSKAKKCLEVNDKLNVNVFLDIFVILICLATNFTPHVLTP